MRIINSGCLIIISSFNMATMEEVSAHIITMAENHQTYEEAIKYFEETVSSLLKEPPYEFTSEPFIRFCMKTFLDPEEGPIENDYGFQMNYEPLNRARYTLFRAYQKPVKNFSF